MVLYGTFHPLNGNTRPVCHLQVRTCIGVEKRSLSTVRISDEADCQIFFIKSPHYDIFGDVTPKSKTGSPNLYDQDAFIFAV